MLAHAARRNVSKNTLRQLWDRTTQPYICSTCLRQQRKSHTRARNLDLSASVLDLTQRRQPNTPTATRQQSRRKLATAADTFSSNDPIPFLTSSSFSPDHSARSSDSYLPLSQLRSWDANSPLVVPQGPTQFHTPSTRSVQRLQLSGGDAVELVQNLRASLVVGRWERGERIVRRLAQMFLPNAPEMLEAHKIYLGAIVDAASRGHDAINMTRVQQWFEVEIRQSGIEPDAEIMALMCRAAFACLEGSILERTLRRYLQIADEAGLLDDTLASGTLLESEFNQLVALRRDVFTAPRTDTLDQEYIEEVVKTLRTPPGESVAVAEGSLPPVLETPQKGLGMETLRKTLRTLHQPGSVPIPDSPATSAEEQDRLWAEARQEQMEKDVSEAFVARWQTEYDAMIKKGLRTGLGSKEIKTWFLEWYGQLAQIVKKDLEETDELSVATRSLTAEEAMRVSYAPYLASLKPETTAGIVISTVLDSMILSARQNQGFGDGVMVSRVSKEIGLRLARESVTNQRRKFERDYQVTQSVAKYRKQLVKNLRKDDTAVTAELAPVQAVDMESKLRQFQWPLTARLQLAAALIAKLIDVAKFPSQQTGKSDESTAIEPAFRYHQVVHKGKNAGMLLIHPNLVDHIAKDRIPSTLATRLPMIIPPLPWTGFRKGAYLRDPVNVVRADADDHLQSMYAKTAAEKGDLDQLFAGLTALGKTGWRVNRRVLSTMLEAWNTGEQFGKMPPRDFKLELPPEPSRDASVAEKFGWKKKCDALRNEASGHHSNRCFQNLQLEIARAFADETFYMPHNIDFRGRAYPIPPHLNHMGADNARGLLMFAKGKELGVEGLKWLKVHLANLSGFDKASLAEREEFAMKHIENIRDTVANPIGGRRWWMKADDPWQCLATCYELADALALDDPTKYVSHLAVHQDGTCNGLQHYAALGGDKIGAAAVNLEPGERPADVYTGVANLVRNKVEQDAAAGEPLAEYLLGKITRKVVKQTVMTTVYGVTFIGARDQVLKQLDANHPENTIINFQAAGYIATNIFKSLGEMFRGAQAIQSWLGECAGRISMAVTKDQIKALLHPNSQPTVKDTFPQYRPKFLAEWQKQLDSASSRELNQKLNPFRSPVIWTTPLKLPVVQPYRQPGSEKSIPTVLQQLLVRKSLGNDPVSKRKQLQGFPPNFIHSLDATHMLLSALKCDESGLTFAAVHDSFWTHAADIPIMNNILRDAFVRMHSEDIVGRLAAEFKARYGGSYYLTSVPSGSPLGQAIRTCRKHERELALKRNAKSKKGNVQDQSRDKKEAETKNRKLVGSQPGSHTLIGELLSDAQRLEMLDSSDEGIRERAREMRTPTSIFLEMGGVSSGEDSHMMAPAVDAIATDDRVEASERRDSRSATVRAVADSNENTSALVDNTAADSQKMKDQAAKSNKKKQVKPSDRTFFWAPLEFPEVPKKGDWDVKRLKDSTYFFS